MLSLSTMLGGIATADKSESGKQFDADTYKVIYEKNVFSKNRLQDQKHGRSVERKKTVVISLYVLKGIAFDGKNKTAFIEEQVSGQTFRAETGDTVINGKIVDIMPGYVVFEDNGETKNITVGEDFGSTETVETVYENDIDRVSKPPEETEKKTDEDDILKIMMERRQQQLGN